MTLEDLRQKGKEREYSKKRKKSMVKKEVSWQKVKYEEKLLQPNRFRVNGVFLRPCKTGKLSLMPYQNDYGNWRF